MSTTINMNKLPLVIEPNKCIVEDLEILSFESEEQLDYYSVWRETWFDLQRESKAESERERQIIRNEIVRKTNQYLIGSYEKKTTRSEPEPPPPPPPKPEPEPEPDSAQLPNGLSILNSTYYNTLPSSKQLMKYKLTKLYNKYRGRQLRRNIVFERQRNLKIAQEESKCHLNSWLAYTALQALRLPDNNLNQLSTATNHNTKFLTTITPTTPFTTIPTANTSTPTTQSKKVSQSSAKKQKHLQQQTQQQQQLQQNQPSSGQMPPMHFVYIDPGSIITYSNKINPQQVAEYRQNAHMLPSSATSKKSSAASYDVYEIMEVLANSNKNHVTITRNANRPAQPGCSVYSHSVNSNTPGIVSTQLHLQARSYLDSMGKFYAEEIQRLKEQPHEPSIFDDLEDGEKLSEGRDSDLEMMEEDIMATLKDGTNKPTD